MSPSIPQSHIVSQFRSVIWHSLDNGLLPTALFVAERLSAYDPKGADSIYLFALCLYRDGQYKAAEGLTRGMSRHVGCVYVFAQCCLQLGGGRESQGITMLEGCKRLWSGTNSWNKHTDTDRRTLPDAAAVYCLLGKLWQSVGDVKKAVDAYVAAVKLNPFLWEAFTGLCDTGVNLRVNNIFKPSHEMLESLKLPSSMNSNIPATILEEASSRQGNHSRNTSENLHSDPFSATTAPGKDRSDLAFNNHPSFFNRLNEGLGKGGGQMETPTAQSSNSTSHDLLGGGEAIPDKPPPVRKTRAATTDLASRKLTSRSTREVSNDAKRSTSSLSQEAGSTSSSAAAQAPARRSTRLLNTSKFTSKLTGGSERETRLAAKEREREREIKKAKTAGSKSRNLNMNGSTAAAKERDRDRASGEDVNVSNHTHSLIASNTHQPRRVTRASTARAIALSFVNKEGPRAVGSFSLTGESEKQMTDFTTKPPQIAASLRPQVDEKKQEAMVVILDLFTKLGNGYFNIGRYNCLEALQIFTSLPPNQRDTPWVQSNIGKAYYELASYPEAERAFLKVRQLDPVRTLDMEIFSTILWHQRKEVDLSYLAHELIELDRTSPQAWCTLGNCFSLQREHDQALKCFKRATQLDPKLAYAFTLQGHEHVSNEEYEKALSSYRCAIAADGRHYNAWYGLGKVYEKMGKYEVAERHFRTASKINPTNAVLVCCVGMVLEKMKDFHGALAQYHLACKMAPRSVMSRFKKARTLMNMHNHHAALVELMILKDLAPDEANVHFSLGKLHKQLRDKTSAIKHFTIALNLDPRAGHLIKEAIENLDDEEDGYPAEDSEVYRLLDH